MTESCPCDAVRRLQDDMDTVKTDISKLYKGEGVFEARLDAIEDLLSRVEQKLDKLSERPARRWETVVTECIKYAVTAVLSVLLLRMGLSL